MSLLNCPFTNSLLCLLVFVFAQVLCALETETNIETNSVQRDKEKHAQTIGLHDFDTLIPWNSEYQTGSKQRLSLILTQCLEHARYSQHRISMCVCPRRMSDGWPSQVMHTEDGKAKASNYDNSTFRFLSINYSLWLSASGEYKGMEREIESLKKGKEFNIRTAGLRYSI
jgi:hypothetical protein